MLSSSSNNRTLQKEMKLLRSFMIGVAGKDKEGAYRPEFVKRVLSALNEQPVHRFHDARSFLDQLENN